LLLAHAEPRSTAHTDIKSIAVAIESQKDVVALRVDQRRKLRIKLDLRLAVDQRGFAEIFEAALKAFHTKELSIGASGIFDRSANKAIDCMSSLPSTTLADLLTPLLGANPFSTVRASFRWQLSDERDDGVADGRQAWLRRRSMDSFFPASLF
jgi:hypothetical protein